MVQIHSALQVHRCVHRDVALAVGRAEVDALNCLLPTDRVRDVHTDFDIGPRHADQVQSTSDSEHCEPLLGDRLEPYEVEDVICSFRQKIADGLDGLSFCGIDDVGGTKSQGLVESLRLEVDDDDPRRACDARSTNGIEPNSSGAEDHDRVPGANVCGVQDGTGAGYNSAAKQRSLRERKLLGYDGKLVLVDERAFSIASQPKALEQGSPIAAQPRSVRRSAHRPLRMASLNDTTR